MKRDLHVVQPAKRGPSLQRIKQAVKLWRSEFAPRAIRRGNARKWLLAVERLGDKWLYAKPIKVGKA